MAFKHIMFDIDGTLVNTTKLDSKCFFDAAHQVLNQPISTNWNQYAHATDSGILTEAMTGLGIDKDHQRLQDDIKIEFLANLSQHLQQTPIKPIQGAVEAFNHLKQHPQVSISIATGGWQEGAMMKLESAGFNVSDVPFASSNDHFARTEIMKIAAQKAQVSDQKTITYFGDAPWDKRACHELQWQFVLIGERTQHHQQLDDFSNIPAMKQLLGII